MVESFVSQYPHLEIKTLVEQHGIFHKRIKSKNGSKYYIDYWHTGKYRSLDGILKYSGYEDESLKEEIVKFAGFNEKTVPIRGIVTNQQIEISGNAIDTVSLRYEATWRKMAEANEGIHAWLVRMATEALQEKGKKERIEWKGLILLFFFGECSSILRAVSL